MRVAEALVGDEDACIVMTALNDQVDYMIPGDTLELLNANVDMYEGWMRLRITSWGSIRKGTFPATFTVSTDNLSAVEYDRIDPYNS